MLHQRAELKLDCAHYGHILAIVMKSHENLILIGDLLRSITVLKYLIPAGNDNNKYQNSGMEKGKLVEIARDFNVNSMRAVEFFHNSNFYLGTEDYGNMFIAKRQIISNIATTSNITNNTNNNTIITPKTPPEEKGRLLIHGEYHIGDTINTLQPGSLNIQPKDQINFLLSQQGMSLPNIDNIDESILDIIGWEGYQTILYGSSCGSIGSIISIPKLAFKFYHALEIAIRNCIQGIGGFSHAEYRSLFNGRRNGSQTNVIDGDLIEMFLFLKIDDMNKIVQQLNSTLRSQRSLLLSKNINNMDINNTTGLSDIQKTVLTGTAWTSQSNNSSGQDYYEFTVDDVISRIEEILRLH